MSKITIRNRDLWTWCQDLYRTYLPLLQQCDAPGNRAKWRIRTSVEEDWVAGDPVMLQMIHDAAKAYESRAMWNIAKPFWDYPLWQRYKGKRFDQLSQAERKEVNETLDVIYGFLVEKNVNEAEKDIALSVSRFHRQLDTAVLNYKYYGYKEGIQLTSKFLSLGGGAVFTGVGMLQIGSGVGAIPGVVQAVLGVAGCIQNVAAIFEQIVHLAMEAEKLQKEINVKMALLEKRYKISKLKPMGENAVCLLEGALYATVLKGFEGIVAINLKEISELVDRYRLKVDGILKSCHVASRELDAYLKKCEIRDRELENLPTEEFRDKFQRLLQKVKPEASNLTGRVRLQKGEKQDVNRALGVERLIDKTTKLYLRALDGREVSGEYRRRIGVLEGKTDKRYYEKSKKYVGFAWTISQIVFGVAHLGNELPGVVTGIGNAVFDGMDMGAEIIIDDQLEKIEIVDLQPV